MDIKQITLKTVSVTLNSEKIKNTQLDQIPRIDFCDLLVNNEGTYTGLKNIEIVCRFSIASFLNSQRRIYKSHGHDMRLISKLMKHFDYQDEAFIFTIEGQIYCDSFSLKYYTKKYPEILSKLKIKISNTKEHLEKINCILALTKSDIKPSEIVSQCRRGESGLPRPLTRKNTKNSGEPLDNLGYSYDWDDDEVLDDFEDDNKTKDQNELKRIIKKFGTWDDYISALKKEVLLAQLDKNEYDNYLDSYVKEVSNIISIISSKPYAILGC